MKIERMNKGSWGKVRAFFDLATSEGFTIKGFKIIEGINGLFVSMPSQKNKDDEYFDSVYASKELRDELNQLALDNYSLESTETLSTSNTSMPEPEKVENDSVSKEKETIVENTQDKNEPFSEDDIPF